LASREGLSVTEPLQPGLAEPDLGLGTLHSDPVGLPDSAPPSDVAEPGVSYGIDNAPQPRLRTFDEMLPATRAFHRNRSKS
jgi:hypothetical protein